MSAVLVAAGRNGSTFLQKPFNNILMNSHKINRKRSSCSSESVIGNKKNYSTPRPPKDPPDNDNPSCVDHEALETPDFIPPSVFRPFTSTCEFLGPGANKRGCYKNPEYYSYHRYSFAALQRVCLQIRDQRKEELNIRCIYNYEQSDDENYSNDEDKN